MQFRQWLSVGVALASLMVMPAAKAAIPHSLGRHLGVCWGDGYHSRTACPPKRNVAWFPAVESTVPSGPTPWWKIPAPEGERVPTPSASEPTPGASLFRQPGEGSSVMMR